MIKPMKLLDILQLKTSFYNPESISLTIDKHSIIVSVYEYSPIFEVNKITGPENIVRLGSEQVLYDWKECKKICAQRETDDHYFPIKIISCEEYLPINDRSLSERIEEYIQYRLSHIHGFMLKDPPTY